MNWLKIPNHTQESLYVHWKKWGRKFKKKKQQQIVHACLAATAYYIWRAHNYAQWEKVVLRPATVIRSIQVDVYIRAKSRVTSKWSVSEKSWLDDISAQCLS